MQSYPFTSQVTYDEEGLPLYDRAVNSEFLRDVFKQYFSDGVFYSGNAACLQVAADTGMQVKVSPGACHIQGAMGIEYYQRTLVVQAAGAQDRPPRPAEVGELPTQAEHFLPLFLGEVQRLSLRELEEYGGTLGVKGNGVGEKVPRQINRTGGHAGGGNPPLDLLTLV